MPVFTLVLLEHAIKPAQIQWLCHFLLLPFIESVKSAPYL